MLNKPFLLSSLSLKTKITGLVLILFLCNIWVLTFFISERVEHEMITQIETQQFSTASYIADSIEVQVKLRINALTTIADRITLDILANPSKLREFLRDKPLLTTLFQKGCVVISRGGIGIADYPVLPGRAGASYSDREYFKEVVATGRPVVGEPGTGRFSQEPVIRFAVPVMTSPGKLVAVLAGYTLASDPSLLGSIKSPAYEDFPDRLLLVSPKDRIFISASDPLRIMQPTPKIGVNPLFDRFMAGFEGSGVAVNSRGIRMLLSAKQIPTLGWFIRVGLPTELAFSSIRSMKDRAYLIAVILSLLSSLLVWIIVRQALRPLYNASRLIRDITEERLPPQDIPVTQSDEVGQLLTSFNVHLNYRKSAEDTMRKSEEKFRTIADFTYGWEYWIAPTDEILYCSPSSTRISGYSPEEFIKTPSLLQSIIHPGDMEFYRRHIEVFHNSYDDGEQIQFRIRTKNGDERWIGHACKAVFNEEGKFLGRRVSNRDITDSKLKEMEIAESRQHINTLNDNILKMLRIMSHDIRSPLIATSATLKLLLRGTYGKLDESVFQTVKDLSIRITQIIGLAEDCLAKAQVVDSELQIEKNEIDLRREVIEAVLAELAAEIEKKNIFIDNRLGAIPTGTIIVNASKMWLKVVYRNLFSNAIKYGGHGCTIAFGYEDHGSYYRFNVYNTGIPIPEDKRSILFTKFGRVMRDGETVQDGVGMGLFMTKEIINQHGGDIWYEAKPEGNDFIFTLPK